MNTVNKIFLIIFASLLASCSASKELWKEDDPVRQLVVDHGQKKEKVHDITLVQIKTPEAKQFGCYYMHFLTDREVTIKEAREMIVDIAESFVAYANESCLIEDPVTVQHLIINLGFVEEDGSFYEPPSLAYAYLKYGTVHYCYFDNDFGKFIDQDDVIEPYHIAKNIVTSTR